MPRQQQVQVLPQGLKAWRKVRNLSQAGLAAKTDHQVSEALIAQIETGRRQPGLINGRAIAAALEVDLEAFALVFADQAGTEIVDSDEGAAA